MSTSATNPPSSIKFGREYPFSTAVSDQTVKVRLMGPADGEAMLAFGRSLPEEDLFFLQIDITDPDTVAEWIRRIKAGTTISVIAESSGTIIGYANLHHQELRWTRHLGEIRIQVSPAWRGRGLGKLLLREVFQVARHLGLNKIVARMASSQRGARQVFESQGFEAEALLADAVIDSAGRTQDLILMSYDVTGFAND
jgi:L-amino acid N-acyltransferase YncA